MEKLKFILIDNDGISLSKLSKMIERIFKNAPIHIFSNSYKAFELIKAKGENSIIICNIKLPDINGIKFLDKVKENKFKIFNLFFHLQMKVNP